MTQNYRLTDASLKVSVALPDGAETTISDGFPVGSQTANAQLPGNFELVVSAPALSSTQLPDGSEISYSIVSGINADLSAPVVVVPNVLVQIGAGGTGAPASTATVRLPPETLGFVGLQATNSGSADASASIATLQPFF